QRRGQAERVRGGLPGGSAAAAPRFFFDGAWLVVLGQTIVLIAARRIRRRGARGALLRRFLGVEVDLLSRLGAGLPGLGVRVVLLLLLFLAAEDHRTPIDGLVLTLELEGHRRADFAAAARVNDADAVLTGLEPVGARDAEGELGAGLDLAGAGVE